MFSRLRTPFLALPVVLALAACGQTPGERAVSGGLLGAGTGAVVAGATGGNVGTGLLLGAGVGAVGGALTAPQNRGDYRDDRRRYRDDRGCYDRRGRYVC